GVKTPGKVGRRQAREDRAQHFAGPCCIGARVASPAPVRVGCCGVRDRFSTLVSRDRAFGLSNLGIEFYI
ncbi:hypothetical protein J2S03_003087, partial [Alicyclobacillus cycloheptanicus]|nr:hypothetical protein [Alicyclobacillus cycloheptanicus]